MDPSGLISFFTGPTALKFCVIEFLKKKNLLLLIFELSTENRKKWEHSKGYNSKFSI